MSLLLTYTARLLPQTADVIVLGDGEFGHVQLLKRLETLHPDWDYCLRVARDTSILFASSTR